MKIVFATNNKHKLEEAKEKLKSCDIEIISLEELGFNEDIEETADTIEGNAEIKAMCIYDRFHVDVFADDTGLEVEALNGRPGVYSSRYAGVHVSYADNVSKLLQEMNNVTCRNACFRTSICLILDGKKYFFEGVVDGSIALKGCGTNGFGYDPVFIPSNYDISFAELPLSIKNEISHRGKALEKMRIFLSDKQYQHIR